MSDLLLLPLQPSRKRKKSEPNSRFNSSVHQVPHRAPFASKILKKSSFLAEFLKFYDGNDELFVPLFIKESISMTKFQKMYPDFGK